MANQRLSGQKMKLSVYFIIISTLKYKWSKRRGECLYLALGLSEKQRKYGFSLGHESS